MKVLARSQEVLMWLCVCPAGKKTQFKATYILFTFGVLGTLILALASSIVFSIKFATSNLEGALHALFVIAALFTVVISNIIMFILRKKMMSIFSQLSEIYTASMKCFKQIYESILISIRCFFTFFFGIDRYEERNISIFESNRCFM